jgi:hypothetical protein
VQGQKARQHPRQGSGEDQDGGGWPGRAGQHLCLLLCPDRAGPRDHEIIMCGFRDEPMPSR